jgi:hypothetical protein
LLSYILGPAVRCCSRQGSAWEQTAIGTAAQQPSGQVQN